ncbi:cilia- and flagella-associated protein 91-like isoform X2 [Stegodyphus dumicola]|nr:cilia- and flagella-associated protein 91-like isoform X2 [Stegodyphus dumicola]
MENKKQSCVIQGADLWKFYKRPLDSTVKAGDIIFKLSEEEEDVSTDVSDGQESAKFISVETQTDYRESEAQTEPWDPPYYVCKKHNMPEVVSLKRFSYGNGLPATEFEVEHILKTRKHQLLKSHIGENIDDAAFLKMKQLICSQVRTDWNYRISMENQSQIERLKIMQTALAEEIKKQSQKHQQQLKNIWTKKRNEAQERNNKLKKRLQLNYDSVKQLNKDDNVGLRIVEKDKKIKNLNMQVENLLSSYCFSHPDGLSAVKEWIQRQTNILGNDLILPRLVKKNRREQLAETAYQNILAKKRTKLPPKVFHKDYDREESSTPSEKSEIEFEILKFPEERIDLVTVWQQVLRGLAYQKQMLELIEKHKAGLEILLEYQNSGANGTDNKQH